MVPEFSELHAKPIEIARQAGRSGLRPGAAQQRQFEDFDGVFERAGCAAEPKQRMFQEREQGRRLQPLAGGFRGEAGKNAAWRVHQRIAAGIVEFEIPAGQRRHHPPRQRAIRRHQRRRFVQMPRLAHRHRNRQRLHLRIGRLDDGKLRHAACDSCRNIRLNQTVVPLFGRARRPHRL